MRRPRHGGSCPPLGRHRRLRPQQHGGLPLRAPRRPRLRQPLLPGHNTAPPHSTGAMSPSRQRACPDPAWLPVGIILSVACISPSAMGVHEVAEDPLQHGTWCLNRYAEDPSKLSGTQHQFTC